MNTEKLKKLFRKNVRKNCSAVIVAAGSSERMGKNKILLDLGGESVISRTIRVFQNSDLIDEIIVVTRLEEISIISDICHEKGYTKVKSVIEGGADRTQSALAGVSAVSSKAELIAIHDGARPFVTEKIISETIASAGQYMAAVPAVRSVDTVRIVDENGVIIICPDRNYVANIQTPQVFHSDIIKGALSSAVTKGLSLSDDSSAAERMGVKVHTVEGDVDNIKLTVPDDFVKAAAILKSRGEV